MGKGVRSKVEDRGKMRWGYWGSKLGYGTRGMGVSDRFGLVLYLMTVLYIFSP